jgi:hypothetical protein
MQALNRSIRQCNSGQALLETALILPTLLMLVFNGVNFGYFLLVALDLGVAPRSGVLYSIAGTATPGSLPLPSAGPSSSLTSVSYLTYQDLGALSGSSNAPVQVCSEIVGLNSPGMTNQTAQCSAFGNSFTFPSPTSDPESPLFVLHQVDVAYTFSPIIPGTPFGIALLPASACTSSQGNVSCTIHRMVAMRAME